MDGKNIKEILHIWQSANAHKVVCLIDNNNNKYIIKYFFVLTLVKIAVNKTFIDSLIKSISI